MVTGLKSLRISILGWLDNSQYAANTTAKNQIDWARAIPFVGLHLACFGAIFVSFSWFALIFALALYVIRMFAITAFYHRYFAHKAFKTSRIGQFIFAVLGASAVQRGPLWWASHHRNHHAHSDDVVDAHSPHQHGFLWSHIGWFLSRANFSTQLERVKELAHFPELRFLDRFDVIIPIALAASIYALGETLAFTAPHLNTNGFQLFIWGFILSTVLLYHGTFCVNSLAHKWGKRSYASEAAEDGQQGLEKWRSGRYALVLADVHMPVMDGYEMTRALRSEESRRGLPRTPVVALTAAALKGETERCLNAGMDDYLAKPVSIAELVGCLQKWLPHTQHPDASTPVIGTSALPLPPTSTRLAPLDPQTLDILTGGDRKEIRALLDDFLDATAQDLAALLHARETGDTAGMASEAHKIKGAARMVGAPELAFAATELELAAKSADWPHLLPLLVEIQAAVERLQRHVQAVYPGAVNSGES